MGSAGSRGRGLRAAFVVLAGCAARAPRALPFTKMQGAGNDFVCVDAWERPLPDDPGALARAVCDRRTGVGADGLLWISASRVADARMILFNADGSRAQMCGNGIRCVAKYLYDRGRPRRPTLRIETDAGVKTIRVHAQGDAAVAATVDMGPPVSTPERLTLAFDDGAGRARTVEGERISMGNPHFVVFLETDVASHPVESDGRAIERHPAFPERTNVEFVRVLRPGEIAQRTWERGAGETLACGTGACASAVAAIRRGVADGQVLVRLLGGDLRIEWDGRGSVFMTGPAAESFAGAWPLPSAGLNAGKGRP